MQPVTAVPFKNYDQLVKEALSLASSAPDLIHLSSIGTSSGGRDIVLIEAGDKQGGEPFHRRPAFLLVGNIHANEFSGSEVCLRFLRYIVERHPHDENLQSLLKEWVICVIPRLAVDGGEYILQTLNKTRSAPPSSFVKNCIVPQDINRDGLVLSMRVEDPDGNMKLSSKDPRVLVRRGKYDDQGPFYRLYVEGMAHEWDGGEIHDVPPGVDFNRNFPGGWKPLQGTSLSGPFPLSEKEPRALVDFICSRPNIMGAIDFHTGNAAVFYPYHAINDRALFNEDAKFINELAQFASNKMGFPKLSGYAELRTGEHASLPGCFKDWLYDHRGIPSILIELGWFYNSLGFKTEEMIKPSLELMEQVRIKALEWHDSHKNSTLFFDWTPFQHPQLGEVEIGGWNDVLWANRPFEELAGISEKCIDVILNHLTFFPKIKVEAESENLGHGLYKVTAYVENAGTMPTYGTRRRMEIFSSRHLQIDLSSQSSIEMIVGRKSSRIDHLKPREKRKLEWVVKSEQQEAPTKTLTVTISSDNGIYGSDDVQFN